MAEQGLNRAQRRRRMREENKKMKRKVQQMGGTVGFSNECSPEMTNLFLKRVLAYEEANATPRPKSAIRSIFPDNYAFPSVESLNEQQLVSKLEHIEAVLESSGVFVKLNPTVPPALKYGYIVDSVLPTEETLGENDSEAVTFLGCEACCEECFQLEYCPTGQKPIDDEDD